MMAYLLDGLLLLIFAWMVMMGIRRGFVRTISAVLSFVLALILSSVLAAPAASLAYDTLVEPKVLSSFGEEAEEGITADQVNDALGQMPAFVTDQLKNQGFLSGEQVLNEVEDKSISVAQGISDQVVAPTVKVVLEPICSLVLFIVLHFLLGWLLRVLNLLTKIPGIKQANKVLGVVAGVLQGLLWVFFTVTLMDVLAATGLFSFLTPEVIEASLLVDLLTAINPLGSAIQSFLM